MSFLLKSMPDPDYPEEILENQILKITAYRYSNENGASYSDPEISIFPTLETSKSKSSRLKFPLSRILALTPEITPATDETPALKAPTEFTPDQIDQIKKSGGVKGMYEILSSHPFFADAEAI